MRAVICGDVHIGAIFGLGKNNGTGGNTRVDDYERSLNYIVDYTINTEADIFIQTGDLFEIRNPTPEQIEIADRAIKKLSDNHIFTVIIMGNHDYKKTGETFTSSISSLPAKNYSNVRLLLEPENIVYTNKNGDKANLFMIPYRDKRMYPGPNQKECVESFNSHISSLFSSLDLKLPTLTVGHNFFFKGNYFDFGGGEVLLYPDSVKKSDLVVMGHLHEFSMVRKKDPISYYVGSLEKTNFGEAKVDKYFIDFNFNTKEIKTVKTPVREIEDIEIDLRGATTLNYLELAKEFLSEKELSDKIIRIKLLVKENLSSVVNKNEIEKFCHDRSCFLLTKILIDVSQTKSDKNQDILNHKNDYDIFKAYAEMQDLEPEMLKLLLEESKRIIG